MSVISGQDYYDIAVSCAAAVDSMQGAPAYMWDAVYTVVLLQQVTPEIDLLSPFYNAYTTNTTVAINNQSFVGAVRALQSHVLTSSTYNTVSAYIRAQITDALGLLVPEEFADISADAGYTIDSDLIG